MTLIEVLVALLIFSFGVLGLVGLQGRAHSIASSAEDSNRAALLANEVVTSIVLNQNYDGTIGTVNAATWSALAASAVPNGSLVFGPATAGNKQMPVTIYWKAPTAAAGSVSNSYTTQVVLP